MKAPKPFVVFLIRSGNRETIRTGTVCVEPGEHIIGIRTHIPADAKIIQGGISSPYVEELTILEPTSI